MWDIFDDANLPRAALSDATMRLHVNAATTLPMDLRLLRGWGTVVDTGPTAPGESSSKQALVCAASGSSDEGSDVIALLDAPAPDAAGAVAVARDDMCFPKPRSMSHKAAAQLPMLALTAAAALLTVGLPPGASSVGMGADRPATVLVAGSSGRLPELLVQVLAARGAHAMVAAASDADAARLTALGARAAVNYNVESFVDAMVEADAVVDCVWREPQPSRLRDGFGGAAYVSVASPELMTLCDDGAIAMARSVRARWGKPPQEIVPRVWTADGLAAAALEEVLSLIECGRVAPPAEANLAAELLAQYGEFLGWSRDADGGQRFGFPGDTLWLEAQEPPARRRLPPRRPRPSGGSGYEW